MIVASKSAEWIRNSLSPGKRSSWACICVLQRKRHQGIYPFEEILFPVERIGEDRTGCHRSGLGRLDRGEGVEPTGHSGRDGPGNKDQGHMPAGTVTSHLYKRGRSSTSRCPQCLSRWPQYLSSLLTLFSCLECLGGL